MKNNWSNSEAKKYVNKYKKLGHSRDMALRVYTTRLLGRNSELVLHGGGNTSVKIVETNLVGEEEEILYVKGSGSDLISIEKKDFSPVRLAHMLKLAKLETLSDPKNILNPDVLLTKNQKLHIENIKTVPIVSDEIDLCVECGFCEPVCPSREITMTPRQRIAIQRELSLDNADPSVLKDYNYEAIETCATDGLCELACPVNINTGSYMKSLKEKDLSNIQKYQQKFFFH